jgi:hypothetical protein
MVVQDNSLTDSGHWGTGMVIHQFQVVSKPDWDGQ